jgi:hypothetical protein
MNSGFYVYDEFTMRQIIREENSPYLGTPPSASAYTHCILTPFQNYFLINLFCPETSLILPDSEDSSEPEDHGFVPVDGKLSLKRLPQVFIYLANDESSKYLDGIKHIASDTMVERFKDFGVGTIQVMTTLLDIVRYANQLNLEGKTLWARSYW